jgi:hypothetical protein
MLGTPRTGGEAMRYLIHGTAFIAVLAVAASAWAQGQSNPPAASAPGSAPSANTALKSTENATAASRPKRHVRRARPYARYYAPDSYYHRGGGWPTDNMADEMNRTELENYGYGRGGGRPTDMQLEPPKAMDLPPTHRPMAMLLPTHHTGRRRAPITRGAIDLVKLLSARRSARGMTWGMASGQRKDFRPA